MRQIALALGVIVTLLMAGCASNKGIDESGYSNKPLVDRHGHKLNSADAKRLYHSARDYLTHGQPKQALPLYNRLESRFPFSKYAPQAQLEAVAAHYRAGQYDDAVSAADRFIKQHPRNAHIDYVYYMRGMANYARNNPRLLGSNPDKRNVKYLKQAFNDFSLLLKNYPNSVYDKDAQLHMINIRNRVAAFDLHIANYYYDRRAYVAASRRAQYIIKHYQGSTSMPRALEIMEESYAKLDLPELAENTRAVLQASYPNYLLHRKAFYRQQAGKKLAHPLPNMGAQPGGDQSSQGQSSGNANS